MQTVSPQPLNGHFNIGIVISRFNLDITQKLLDSCVNRLLELGLTSEQITEVWVPGAVEIPITAQRLAKTNRFEGIICLGAVVFGETRHFDFVCSQVSQGCQQVALAHDIPVIFGVLTTDTILQAEERTGGTKGNMGQYAADTAYELISVLRQL